ncbi:MAG: hypothetical protein GY752_01310 [bacterium]|nr:hypothetical protein [bacterium]MCP4798358.1 hypothetical protein [bacterium]
MASKLALLALLFLIGCGGTPPAKTDYSAIKERASGANYPEAQYIVSRGISNTSQREADLDAKAQVAEQVRSSIRSEVTAFAKAVILNGSSNDSEVLTSKIQASAEFSRAEMIKIARGSRKRIKGQYQSVAYISRSELSQILIAEYELAAVAFHQHDNPDLANDLAAFTSSWKQAKRAYTQMAATACEIQAVTRRPYQPLASDRELLKKYNRQRLTWLSNIHVAVRIRDGGNIDTYAMAESISGAMTELGLVADGNKCTDGLLLLDLTPSVSWKKFYGNDVCEVTLSGSLENCATGNVLSQVSISGLNGEGRDPIRKMHNRATPEKIAPMLSESLEHVLPF